MSSIGASGKAQAQRPSVVRHADGTTRLPRARDHLGRVAGRSVSIMSSLMVVNGVPPSGWSGRVWAGW
jgi:hypothetical protein